MVVDSSALVSILIEEPGHERPIAESTQREW